MVARSASYQDRLYLHLGRVTHDVASARPGAVPSRFPGRLDHRIEFAGLDLRSLSCRVPFSFGVQHDYLLGLIRPTPSAGCSHQSTSTPSPDDDPTKPSGSSAGFVPLGPRTIERGPAGTGEAALQKTNRYLKPAEPGERPRGRPVSPQ